MALDKKVIFGYTLSMNEIEWTPKAVKQFQKLPIEAQRFIGGGISSLADWPRIQNVKKLSGRNDYRLRVGNFRVLFTVHPSGKVNIIRIEEVKKRNEHTY